MIQAAIAAMPAPLRDRLEEIRTRRRIANRVIVPERALEQKYEEALEHLLEHEDATELGDYLEFGVFNGRSMACFDRASRRLDLNNMRIFGFDSFQGLPPDARADDGGHWKPGSFASPIDLTQQNLRKFKVDLSRVQLIPGWFSDTCVEETAQRHGILKASVIMVDCDMYLSTVDCLRFIGPLVADRAILIFDDWNSAGLADKNLGERRAFEEFLIDNPQFEAEPFGSYCRNSKCFVLHRRAATCG
jgi:O-methyltransferase